MENGYDESTTDAVGDLCRGEKLDCPTTITPSSTAPATKDFKTGVIVLESIMMVLIVYGNGMVVLGVALSKSLRTMTHMFIQNLAVADLLMGLVGIPLDLMSMILYVQQYTYDQLRLICLFKFAISYLSGIASLVTIGFIAILRCVVVKFPSLTKHQSFVRCRRLSIVFIWLYSSVVSVIFLTVGYRENFAMPCTLVSINSLWFNRLVFSHPISVGIVATVCYLVIFRTMRSNRAKIQVSANGPSTCAKENRLTKIMLTVVSLFFICWLPASLYILGNHNDVQELTSGFKIMINMIYANSFINPIIYVLTMPDFRQSVACIMKCTKRGANDPSGQESNPTQLGTARPISIPTVRPKQCTNGVPNQSSNHSPNHSHVTLEPSMPNDGVGIELSGSENTNETSTSVHNGVWTVPFVHHSSL